MEKPKIINLGEERIKRQRSNNKETKLGVSSDGYLLYPKERKTKLTIEDALSVANDIIKKYGNPETLLEDFSSRKVASTYDSIDEEKTENKLKIEMETSLDFQRKYAQIAETDELVEVLATHRESPSHYYGTMILAIAEELQKRLNNRKRIKEQEN